MIYVPEDASTVLPQGNPKAGGIGKIDAAAAYVLAIAQNAAQYQLSIRGAQQEFIGVTSEGVAKIDSKLAARLVPGAQTLQRSTTSAKAAFNSYAAEVNRINVAADKSVTNIDDALVVIRASASTIAEISQKIRSFTVYPWNEGAPGVMPDPSLDPQRKDLTEAEEGVMIHTLRSTHEQQWIVASSTWQEAIGDIEAALTAWSTLIANREAAEAALVQSLNETDIGQLMSIHGGAKIMPPFTIATSISGELWGESAGVPELAKHHPLLQNLLGSTSGARVWDAPPDPDGVASQWAVLNDDDKERLINEVPWVIGNLPGLPYGVRDRANRKLMDYYIVHGGELNSRCRTALADLLDIVQQGEDSRPPVQVVALNLDGEVPLVAVGFGDIDSATSVTVEVPGMESDADVALKVWNIASRNLYNEQASLLKKLNLGKPAVIAFLSYDTPNLKDTFGGDGVLNTKLAQQGAPRLSAELDGLSAASLRAFDGLSQQIAVIAHSYGTTTAANSLAKLNHPIDSFVMVGSAGLDTSVVRSLDDLAVLKPGNGPQSVYATHSNSDNLAPLGLFYGGRGNPNPNVEFNTRFNYDGAIYFSSEGNDTDELKKTDGHTVIGRNNPALNWSGFQASDGHGYWDVKTQSLRNMSALSLGFPSMTSGGLYAK